MKRIPNELRILISTDVLSEGQNLQDGHIIVNYDLPWALIRLVKGLDASTVSGRSPPVYNLLLILPQDGPPWGKNN